MSDPNPLQTGSCQSAQSNVTLQAVDGLVRAGGFSQPGEIKAQLVLIQPKENPAYARFQEGRQVLGPLLYIGQLGLDIPAAFRNNTWHWQRKMSQSSGVGSNPFKPLRPYSPRTFEGRVNRRLFLPRKFHDLLLSEDKLAELRNSVRRNRFKGNVFALLERGTRLGTDVSALLSADYQNAGGREFTQYGAIALD